jgi:ribosome-associated translation inhibitor RaiA
MRINVRLEGFQLTPQLRGVVVSRLLSAVGQFGAYIELVDVRLQASAGHTRPDTTICDIAVSLRTSGDIRARGEGAHMPVAIDRAAEHIRSAVECEVSRLQAAHGAPQAVGPGPDALELVLHGNQISQHQREWLERPENYLRPVRVREYWRPPGVEDDEVPKELEPALAAPR